MTLHRREIHGTKLTLIAEEAARFLHNACRGLASQAISEPSPSTDRFHIQAVEHALGYFGSCVLDPARHGADSALGDFAELGETAQKLGYALGRGLYEAYLAGSLSRSRLRHLFLAHLEPHGRAQELCAELADSLALGRKGPYPDHSSRTARSRLA